MAYVRPDAAGRQRPVIASGRTVGNMHDKGTNDPAAASWQDGHGLEHVLPALQRLANESLRFWDIPEGARATLVNVSENMTYRVDAPGYRSILRIHRPNYHSRRAIECELAWMDALRKQAGIDCPGVITGRDGAAIQNGSTPELADSRFLVMFEFIDGAQPREDDDLAGAFRQLGRIAAATHLHASGWERPRPFERLTWDTEAVFGPRAIWGDWRAGPNVTREVRDILERVECEVCNRLSTFGKATGRYGLIHADMRLANLLIDGERTWLIDFDDCGFSWFLYDFAAAISFMEDHPQVPALKQAWIEGYRTQRPLTAEDIAEIDSFVMLRRMALLAWIGSHIEAPEPQALAPRFASVSAELGEKWLTGSGI
ncbi:MAG: phosphotransferase [Geminicoccaceae bacterium]